MKHVLISMCAMASKHAPPPNNKTNNDPGTRRGALFEPKYKFAARLHKQLGRAGGSDFKGLRLCLHISVWYQRDRRGTFVRAVRLHRARLHQPPPPPLPFLPFSCLGRRQEVDNPEKDHRHLMKILQILNSARGREGFLF